MRGGGFFQTTQRTAARIDFGGRRRFPPSEALRVIYTVPHCQKPPENHRAFFGKRLKYLIHQEGWNAKRIR